MKIKTLKELRRNAGFEQTEFDYSQPYISMVERGIREPTQSCAKYLAGIYGISVRVFWMSWELSKEENETNQP